MPEEKNMFESLRLGNGGGLNSAVEKVAQADNAATIAIGLGGTGKNALREFKKMVYERVKQDNFDKRDTEEPVYKRIRFLAIDSDRDGVESPVKAADLSQEFFYVGVSDIIAELRDEQQFTSKKHLEWFNRKIKMNDASAGAGGVRQIGKYLLSKKAQELYNKILDMITTSVEGLQGNSELNVYIMAGIGGGTGSGCFVDICYLVQAALAEKQRQGSANVLGFFFLPDVNLSSPNFPKGGAEEINLKKNGFAAIKELDYLMNIPNNGDVYVQKYSESFEIMQNVPPVKMCHLLSTTAIDGSVISNGYSYIMNVVAEYALNFVVKAVEADPKSADGGITLKGIQSNITALLQATQKNYGANYVYNILGTSCATVPYKKIGTYLAIKFFDSIKYIQKKRPNKSDVERFCQNIGFNFSNLDVKVRANTRGLTLEANRFDTKVLKGAAVGTISAPLAEYCERWKDDYEGKVTANIATLGRSLDEYEVNNNPESVIGKIFKELITIVNNADLGPYFAAYMINDAQNHTLSSVIAGIRTEVENKRNHAQGQAAYRNKCENDAQAEFRSAMMDMFDAKKKNYVFMVQERYKNEVEINTYNAFLGLIDKIKKHVEKIETEYFKKLTGITDKLIATFEDNAEYFRTHGMGDELYTWSIIDIDSIKDGLDEIVAALTKRTDNDEFVAPYLVEKFNQLMLSNRDKWFDENETKIAELISAFIRNEFKDAMSKSMKQYLQEKYNATGKDLIDCIEEKIIKDGLVARGVPVFYGDSTVVNLTGNASDHTEYIVLSIPNNEPDFEAAAKEYRIKYGKNMGIANNVLTDRIFMLEFFSGIPMYAYKALQDLESEYVAHASPGLHMYESESKNWRNLPSPIPATFESSFYKRPNQESVDATIDVYDRALKEKLIVEDMDNMCAKVYSAQSYDLTNILGAHLSEDAIVLLKDIIALDEENKNVKIAEVIETNKWAVDVADTERALIEINDFINKYKESYSSSVELTAYNRTEKNGKYTNGFYSSLRDDFVMKPIIVNAVKNEIDKIDTLNLVREVLDKIKSLLDEHGDQTGSFIRALLHSVIYRQRSNFKFEFEKRGETEEIILTEDNDAYEDIPVYRAFLKFGMLSSEVVEQIGEKTRSAARNVTDEMYTKTVEFFDFYKENYKDYKSAANKFIENEKIIGFLDDLYDKAERFIRENK